MKDTEKKFHKAGYRVKRATTVLAMSSAIVRAMRGTEGDELRWALGKVKEANFDFDRLHDHVLEVLYGQFDDAFASKVLAEFRFIPARGSCRDNLACTAYCNLCGKGDSRDDGANEDHIRFEFKLTNEAGGEDVWTGSTCIINHQLKVDGAANSEEARRILQKTLREHIAFWKIEQWRAEHPEHGEIPADFEKFRWVSRDLRPYGRYRRYEVELGMVGFKLTEMATLAARLFRAMRTASRFYERRGYLTAAKTETWRTVRSVLLRLLQMERCIREAEQIADADEKLAFWMRKAEEFRPIASEAIAKAS